MEFKREKIISGFRAFYTEVLKRKFTQKHEAALSEIFSLVESDTTWTDVRHVACFLANIGWESGFTYRPVEEILAKSGTELRKKQDKYWLWRGLGLLQITHKINYERVGKLIKVDLVSNPKLLLEDLNISYLAAARGMQHGIFTGKKLSDYIKGEKCDYHNARMIVNGLDKAKEIENFCKSIESILKAAIPEEICETIPDFYQPPDAVADWVFKEDEVKPLIAVDKPETIITNIEAPKVTTVEDKNSEPVIINKHVPDKIKSIYKWIGTTLTGVGITAASLYEFINSAIQNKIFLRALLIVCGVLVILGLAGIFYHLIIKNIQEYYAHQITMEQMRLRADPTRYSVEVKSNER